MPIRVFRILVGLFLLPACVGATLVFKNEVLGVVKAEFYFLAGLASYLVLLAIFQQPIRTYIFGHELTHAVWVWLSGGRVKGFKAAASGGSVRADKSNFLIFLAPYFFPIYSVLAIVLYLGLKLIFPLFNGLPILNFIVGFTWAFHVTFTIYVLLQGQPDIGVTGPVFSLPFIYITNVVVLACLIIFTSPRLSYPEYFSHLWRGVKDAYCYVWSASPGFYEQCSAQLQHVLNALLL